MGLIQFCATGDDNGRWTPYIVMQINGPNGTFKEISFVCNHDFPTKEIAGEFCEHAFKALQADNPKFFKGGIEKKHFDEMMSKTKKDS